MQSNLVIFNIFSSGTLYIGFLKIYTPWQYFSLNFEKFCSVVDLFAIELKGKIFFLGWLLFSKTLCCLLALQLWSCNVSGENDYFLMVMLKTFFQNYSLRKAFAFKKLVHMFIQVDCH